MGGDLNLKKSWHPHLKKNQERVWKAEQSALEERKQIEKLRKEREEERAIEELQRLQESAGGKSVQKRVDWMYAGPSGDGAGVSEEREGYLLGKRRIDNLLKTSESQNLQKGSTVGIDTVNTVSANTARDTQKKVLEDPLLMIQKQKMEMQLKMMKDAQKEAKYIEKREKEKERERRHKEKKRGRKRSRDRNRSRERGLYKQRDRSKDQNSHRGHDRSRDRNRSRSAERESPKHRDQSRDRERHRDWNRKHHNRRDLSHSRSRSPRRRDPHYSCDDYRRRDCTLPRHPNGSARRNWNENRPQRPTPPRSRERDDAKADAAERLAQMQVAATSLEEQRAERIREQDGKDAEEEERQKKNSDGGRRFLSSVRNQASSMNLGDAIARGRPNLRAEVDV